MTLQVSNSTWHNLLSSHNSSPPNILSLPNDVMRKILYLLEEENQLIFRSLSKTACSKYDRLMTLKIAEFNISIDRYISNDFTLSSGVSLNFVNEGVFPGKTLDCIFNNLCEKTWQDLQYFRQQKFFLSPLRKIINCSLTILAAKEILSTDNLNNENECMEYLKKVSIDVLINSINFLNPKERQPQGLFIKNY